MNKISKVIKNYIYNTAYEFLRILAPLLTTPYIARVLGPSGVGTYSFAQSIATYFVLIGSMGTGIYGQREIAYVQDDSEKRTRIFWEVEAFSFCTALISCLAFLFIFGSDGENTLIYRILTIEVLANAIDISWFFKGIENFRIIVIRNTLIKVIGILLVFTLVKRPEDVPLYTLCVTLPIFIGNLSLWFSIKKYIKWINRYFYREIVKHIKPIFVLFIPQVAIEVYAVLDKTMLGILSPDMSQVGYYTQAQKIIRIILLIVTSLGTVMLPAMSAAFAKGENRKIERSIIFAFRFVYLIAFALMFGLCAVSSRFVPFFFGDGYTLVGPLMIVISPILVIIGMSNVIGRQYLLPTRQQRAFTVSVVTGAVVNLILNYILIRKYNAIGASVATVIAEICVTGVQVWYVRKQLPLKECLIPMFRYFIMGGAMFLAVRGLGKILPKGTVYMIAMIASGVLIYGIELLVTKDVMLWQGINMIKNKVKKVS